MNQISLTGSAFWPKNAEFQKTSSAGVTKCVLPLVHWLWGSQYSYAETKIKRFDYVKDIVLITKRYDTPIVLVAFN